MDTAKILYGLTQPRDWWYDKWDHFFAKPKPVRDPLVEAVHQYRNRIANEVRDMAINSLARRIDGPSEAN